MPNENYTIKKLFLLIDSWIANYQITKCVLHLDYASKPKNSTEAIYEWNPQLLSCQPNSISILIFQILINIIKHKLINKLCSLKNPCIQKVTYWFGSSWETTAMRRTIKQKCIAEIAEKLHVSHTCIENHLKQLGYVQKLETWVPHELKSI